MKSSRTPNRSTASARNAPEDPRNTESGCESGKVPRPPLTEPSDDPKRWKTEYAKVYRKDPAFLGKRGVSLTIVRLSRPSFVAAKGRSGMATILSL